MKKLNNKVAYFFLIYCTSFFLFLNIARQNTSNIQKLEYDNILSFILLVFFFIEHIKTPKIPNIKPFLLLPNSQKKILKHVLTLLFLDVSKWYLFIPFWACLHAIAIILRNYQILIISLSMLFIYSALLFSSWKTSVTLRFANTRSLMTNSLSLSLLVLVGLLLNSFLNDSYVLLIVSFLLAVIVYYLFSVDIDVLLKDVYSPICNKLKRYNVRYAYHKEKLLFLKKEFRMCIRSRRLKWVFLFTFLYSFFFIILFLWKQKSHTLNFWMYCAPIALSMSFGEYFERLWLWDKNSYGLIFSVPGGKDKYFWQKIIYVFMLGINVLILHKMIFTDKLVALLCGLVLVVAVPIVGGFSSMTSKNLTVDLNASIWDMKNQKLNINSFFTISALLIANWYVIQENDLIISVLYLILLFSGVLIVLKKLWGSFNNNDWVSYGN